MANRTVSVNLELLAAQYKGEADAVIAKTLEMDHEVEALDRDINKLGPDAAKAAAAMALLGQEHGRLAGQADQAADRVDHIGEAIKKTDEEIARSKTLIQELAAEFGRTGDLDLVKKISGEQSNVGRLQKLRADLDGIKADAEKASKEMEKLLAGAGNTGKGLLDFALDEWVGKVARSTKQGITSGLDSLSGAAPTGIVQWLIAGGVAAAPALVAVIDGALLAGVGTIGIGAAIAAQAGDPEIKTAYKDLGGSIKADLIESTAGFRLPLLNLAQDFRADWRSVLPELKSGWDALAPSVEHFGQGVAGLATHTIPGFVAAERASVDTINMLGDELPRVGDAFSSFFQSIANGAEGGKKGLQDTLVVLEATVIWLGKIIEYGSKAFDWADKLKLFGTLGALIGDAGAKTDKGAKSLEQLNAEGNKAANAIANVGASAVNAGLGVQLSADDFKNFSAAINATRRDSDALAASMVDKIIGTTLSLDRATLGVASALTQLGDAFKQNGPAIDKHTKQIETNTARGEANRSAILNVVSANLAQYDAQIKAGVSADDAAAAYDDNTRALEHQMRQAGLTQAQVDQLIGKYRGIPAKVDTDIAIHGLTDAINDLDTTLRLINGIHDKTATVTVTTLYTDLHQTVYNQQVPQEARGLPARAQRYGGVHYAAEGLLNLGGAAGIASGAKTVYGFAEAGAPEAFIAKDAPDAASLAYADIAASWHGGRVVSAAGAGGGGRSEVTHRVVIQEPSGRRIAELVIEDARNGGGTAFNAYVRQVANR